MNVQIILNEDVPRLGRVGDVVKVRAGYARNYLLPRKLAVEASRRNLRAFEHQKRIAMLKREALKSRSLELKEKLEALSLVLRARAGEEGRLFGSITNIDVQRKLSALGFEIDRRRIGLADPIKQLGDFTVPIRIDPEVEAIVKINVAAE